MINWSVFFCVNTCKYICLTLAARHSLKKKKKEYDAWNTIVEDNVRIKHKPVKGVLLPGFTVDFD